MNKRGLSIFLGFVLSFSMFFIGVNMPVGNGAQQPYVQTTPQAGTSIENISVVEGDILYYHYWNEYTNPEDYSKDNIKDEGVVKIEVSEINTSINKIFYDFYMVNMTEMHDDWYWAPWNDEMKNDSARWLEDDFQYNLFNHSLVFPNNITDVSATATSENLDQLIKDAFNSSGIYSEYSDGTSEWNTAYFEVYPDDGPDMMSVLIYINKTTGLMTYYEENQVNHTMHLELAGFDSMNYDFYLPDSFGVMPGDWVDRFVPEMGNNPDTIGDPNHGYYPDWLEPNDDLGMARDLYNEFGAYQGKWFDLNTFENDDYYKFHADAGANIEVYVEYTPGADVVLYTIDPGDGSVIEQTAGEVDEDGWDSISWTAAYTGYYYIKINGSHGFWADKYNFGIIYNGDWGPEFWPDSMQKDGGKSIWIHETVEFIYYNPYFGEDVLIISQDFYREPTMLPEDKVDVRPMKVAARVNSSNPNTAVGEGWFHKDIDFSSADFLSWFDPNMILWDVNLSIYLIDSGTDWLEVTGVVNGTGEDFYFFAQKLPVIGTVQFYQSYIESLEYGRKYQDMSMVIDCSVAGTMKESDPTLGVAEGDWWTYVVQNEWRYDEWGPDMDHHENDESVMMVTFTVTHIFALNFTTMGVVGSIEVQVIHNDGSIDPEHHLKGFQPFLVYDTLNPVSFITMGGLGQMDGPPVLLPAGVDWSTQETAMLDLFNSMPDGPGSPIAWNFQHDTVRMRFDGHFDDTWNQDGGTVTAHRDWKQDIVLDVNEFGMTTHLRQEQREHEDWTFNNGVDEVHGGRDKEERMVAFMSTGSKGCVYETDIASITALQPMDTLVWERSQYHPAGQWGPDDPGNNPADKSFDKIVIGQVLSACDKYVVFLGAQFWKGPGDTDYHPHEWHLNGPDGDIVGNFWYLDSIRKDDIWTWINSNIFDMSITDFAAYSAEIVEILNFAFAPDVTVTASDITFNGTTFEVQAIDGNIKHVFRLAVNNKGIMQDMFMGEYDTTTNEWLNWERNVLVEAPSGYTVGEYFMTDIPSNYVPSSAYIPPSNDTSSDDTSPTDDTTPSNPFGNIPGYTTSTVLIFSLIGVVALSLRKRK